MSELTSRALAGAATGVSKVGSMIISKPVMIARNTVTGVLGTVAYNAFTQGDPVRGAQYTCATVSSFAFNYVIDTFRDDWQSGQI